MHVSQQIERNERTSWAVEKQQWLKLRCICETSKSERSTTLFKRAEGGSLNCMWVVQTHSGPQVFLVTFRKDQARMNGTPQPNQKWLLALGTEPGSLNHESQPLIVGPFLTPHVEKLPCANFWSNWGNQWRLTAYCNFCLMTCSFDPERHYDIYTDGVILGSNFRSKIK